MATITTGVLVALIFIVICVVALVLFGIANIRAAVRAVPKAQELGTEPLWYKQPKALFGINNLAFALLLLFVAGLTFVTAPGVRVVLYVCIALAFLLSLVLVFRSAALSMRVVKNLQAQRKPPVDTPSEA